MATASSVKGTGGINFSQQDTYPQFPVGHVERDTNGGSWLYTKANTALTSGLMYKRLTDGTVGSATVAQDAVDRDCSGFSPVMFVCWPQQAFAAGVYGWVALSGKAVQASVATGIAAGTKLYTSTTPGVLQSTGTSDYPIVGDAYTVGNTTGGAAVISISVTGCEPFLGGVVNV